MLLPRQRQPGLFLYCFQGLSSQLSRPVHRPVKQGSPDRPNKQRQRCLEATENITSQYTSTMPRRYCPTRRRIPICKTKCHGVLSMDQSHTYTTRTCSLIRHAHELRVRATQGLGDGFVTGWECTTPKHQGRPTYLLIDTRPAGLTQATRTHIHYTISAL